MMSNTNIGIILKNPLVSTCSFIVFYSQPFSDCFYFLSNQSAAAKSVTAG